MGKSGNTLTPKTTETKNKELPPIVEEGFLERFSWKDFFCYGALWCVIFFAVLCFSHLGKIYRDQQRQIQDLIDRIHQYEDPDYSDRDNAPPYKDDEGENTTLSSWVKQNLPKDGVEERPAVAGVFENLADMLDDGTLQGQKDAFSEGISQLQPIATRKIWLPFLTKLTKRLQKQNLDNKKLSSAFRVISKAINPQKNRGVLLLEAIAENAPVIEREEQSDQTIEEEEKPSQIEPQEPKTAEAEQESQATPETKDCPGGNCPNTGYSGYYWRYY